MLMGQVLLLGIRGKLKNLFDDLDNSASHPERESILRLLEGKVQDHSLIALPLRSNLIRPVKRSTDNGSSSIAVPSK